MKPWKRTGKGYYKGTYSLIGKGYSVRWFPDGRTEIDIVAHTDWPASSAKSRKNLINTFKDRFGKMPEITLAIPGSKVRGKDIYANEVSWYARFPERPDQSLLEGIVQEAENAMVELIFVKHCKNGGIEEYRNCEIGRSVVSAIRTACEKNGKYKNRENGDVFWTVK